MAERISEAMVEAGARASATKHYAERFRASPDNPQVRVNVDANWYLFADEARTVLTAVLSAAPASAQMEGMVLVPVEELKLVFTVLHFDLRKMREWGADYNQAVKDAGDRVTAMLAATSEGSNG